MTKNNFIICKNSNLPQKKVSHIIINKKSDILLSALEKINISPIIFDENPFMIFPENSHPDMNFCNCDGTFFTNNKSLYNTFLNLKIDKGILNYSELTKSVVYPQSIEFNCCILENFAICLERYTNKELLSYLKSCNKKIINVKQGFSKCSICVVDENSVITEDESIYNTVIKFLGKENCLLINKGFVKLDGFQYGFIGGASFKANKDMLYFCGNIENHPDYQKIYEFCCKKGIKIFSLFDGYLTDYGSPIPVFTFKNNL